MKSTTICIVPDEDKEEDKNARVWVYEKKESFKGPSLHEDKHEEISIRLSYRFQKT